MLLRIARIASAALLAAATAVPRAADAPPAAGVPRLEYEMYQLENGLTVILHQDRTAPLIAIHVEYNVGSKDEKPNRTGFAHLYEHLMFQGSEHLPKGEADRLLSAAGANGNGGTAEDDTVYWEEGPSGALDQILYIESERMGFLLRTIDQGKLDNQREVVLNELRQRYQMVPYGMAFERLMESLWDPEFPYHWLSIGKERDIEAATLEDVREFFVHWYGPNNAVLVVAGDFDAATAKAMVQKWFGGIPARPTPPRTAPEPRPLVAEKRVTMPDRVQLPRVYLAWQSPRAFAAGDAALDVVATLLADGKSARLTGRLEMREQIAQGVSAAQESRELAGAFLVVATPKPGVTLGRLEAEIDEELSRLASEPPSAEELTRAKNKIEAGAVFGLEPLGGFSGRAAALANYYLRTGDPGFLERDLERYRAVTAADVTAAARTYLRKDARVVLEVVPADPAAQGSGEGGEP